MIKRSLVSCYLVISLFTAFTQGNNLDGTFLDPRDQSIYLWVKLGDQVWMAENLNYYTYKGCWCKEGNILRYCPGFGVYYDWDAAMRACPDGWHLPSKDEWSILISYLGGASVAGGKMKLTINSQFRSHGPSVGFNAFPAGYYYLDKFNSYGYWAFFWSSTEEDLYSAYMYILKDGSDDYLTESPGGKQIGQSARCIKDE